MSDKELNCTIGKSYPVKEKPDKRKFFFGLLCLNSLALWLKEISVLFNVRRLIILGLIGLSIYGYAFYRGRQATPVLLDLDYQQEVVIQLNDTTLVKPAFSQEMWLMDNEGNKIKQITVKDLPQLQRKLRPFGFQFKPFFTAGSSLGEGEIGMEAGLGVDFFRYFKFNANTWLTNRGIYLGTGYQITDNFDILGGVGKGFSEGDTRLYIGGKWKF